MAPLRNSQHTFTGVYALDALDTDAEVARFERHMARCQSCASEVGWFRETTTRLGMAVSRQPPPTLRAAVMDEVPRTPQLPALDDRARHRRPGRPPLTWLPRLATAGAAIGLAAAITLGVVLVNTQNQLGQTQQQLSQARHQLSMTKTELAAINAVRTASDATLVTKATPIGGTVTVVSSASRHQIVVTARGLPALRAGKVYQLWLIGSTSNRIRSEGLLALHNGQTGPVLISGVLPGDIFGITLEPAGGTVQPTVKPFVAIPA
jgi:anti-sigma factor RsiW